MKPYNMITKFALPVLAVIAMSGCTKLDESLGSTLTNSQVSNALGKDGTGLLLAAAYAEAGRFQDAVGAAKEAIDVANRMGQGKFAEQVEERLKLYESGKPLRE